MDMNMIQAEFHAEWQLEFSRLSMKMWFSNRNVQNSVHYCGDHHKGLADCPYCISSPVLSFIWSPRVPHVGVRWVWLCTAVVSDVTFRTEWLPPITLAHGSMVSVNLRAPVLDVPQSTSSCNRMKFFPINGIPSRGEGRDFILEAGNRSVKRCPPPPDYPRRNAGPLLQEGGFQSARMNEMYPMSVVTS